ncbi:FixH family protein [Bacillus sp. 179-C3.3 HS]|uniref:FixH family protein n=1 Tax=Bacillus sp. 179-C3.3 HS TaxID=3232162 RepID=UPI0039A2FC0C
MKKGWMLGFLLMFLAACQLDPNTEELYEKPTLIHVNIDTPSQITSQKKQTFRILIKENDKPIRTPADVKISVWKYGEAPPQTRVKAKWKEEGVYTASHIFPEDGLYDIRVDAKTEYQHIMPTKRIAVGHLTEEEKEIYQNKQKKVNQRQSHH